MYIKGDKRSLSLQYAEAVIEELFKNPAIAVPSTFDPTFTASRQPQAASQASEQGGRDSCYCCYPCLFHGVVITKIWIFGICYCISCYCNMGVEHGLACRANEGSLRDLGRILGWACIGIALTLTLADILVLVQVLVHVYLLEYTVHVHVHVY